MNTAQANAFEAQGHAPQTQRRHRDDALYRAAFALSFPLFLVGVALTRLVSGGPTQQGVIAEALDSAHSSIAIALKD